ncbi:MAG: TetR family transcriptional regulator [Pseudonocardia sp.]|nr:TetR family transcriptional regulator [Pseudonocardia sp.]
MASRAPAAKQRRKLEIVDAGTSLIGDKGYGRTTMDDIAAAAGVTKRTLYRYVPSKQDILPMIHERFQEAADALIPADPEDADPVELLTSFVGSYVSVVVAHQDAVRVFFEEEYNLTPAARARIVARRDAFEARFRDLVRRGRAEGRFRQCDERVVAAGVFGALASIYRWYSPTGRLGVAELSEQMSALVLHGLRAPDPGAAAPVAPMPREAADDLADLPGPPPARVPPAVLAAAVHLFATQGYLETNTREIADEAGVTKSGLFYHIGSKDELLYAIHHRFATECVSNLREWTAQTPGPGDAAARLRILVVEHSRVIGDQPELVRVFNDQARYLDPTRRASVKAMRARYVDGFARLVRDGIADGTFRDAEPKVTALAVLGMLNSMSRWYRPDGRLAAPRIGEMFADLVIDGLAVPA